MPGIVDAPRRDDEYLITDETTPATTATTRRKRIPALNYSLPAHLAKGYWEKYHEDISYNHLQKFWCELSPQARQKLLQIDKQTLFEQARKNMYCSRCNGLLLEGFYQILAYGKSLQQEGGAGPLPRNRLETSKNLNGGGSKGCREEIPEASVHPWGGLTTARDSSTTRDSSLTLLSCYLYSKSLKGLEIVFEGARARERERELLYPDACGGGARGWISQGMTGYGRGHGTRETCALHTARLSCDTLVDFWSALGEETRQSLLRMKEEDFIERLMCRFDSKRFCRDCRRNVIREFKELKELKRMRREPRCTSWFCVADTAFQYEMSDDTIQADWRQTFADDTVGTYHHFEWAVGTGEGKSDILEFENVGMNGSVQVTGLDLGGLTACFITLRAWKLDGRCTELSVKAHALKGQPCVHCRLVVGDGFITITRGESIRRFFEHAEEAEEEEDDDSMDKDGNELDGECSRPQKHAKSPELAREFLLDAATVIFKEQVEKAFREGTARQNAHSIFVCLAIKLLEERVHVACKEIITLEKQMKLLEEEEREKREEEERKERRRTKEREKKLRRKERLKGREKDKEQKCPESNDIPVLSDIQKDETSPSVDEEPDNAISCRDSVSETGDISLSRPGSPDIQYQQFLNGYDTSITQNDSYDSPDGEVTNLKDGNDCFEQSKFSRWRMRFRNEVQPDASLKWSDRRRFTVTSDCVAVANRAESRNHFDNFETHSRGINGPNRQARIHVPKSNGRNCSLKFNEKFHSPNRVSDRYDFHSCSCHQNNEYRVKTDPHVSATRVGRENKAVVKSEVLDVSKQFYRGNKYGQTEYIREGCVRPKTKCIMGNNTAVRDVLHSRKVWEPTELQKKYPRSNSDSDVTLRSTFKVEGMEPNRDLLKVSDDTCSGGITGGSVKIDHDGGDVKGSRNCSLETDEDCQNEFHAGVKDPCYSSETIYEEVSSCPTKSTALSGTSDPSIGSTSNSDNCSSCLSEGDSNTASSNHGNLESSSTSDSEDSSQQSEGRETSECIKNGFSNCHDVGMKERSSTNEGESFQSKQSSGLLPDGQGINILGNPTTKTAQNPDNGNVGLQHQGMFPPMHNPNLQYSVFQAPSTMGYYHQNPVSWPATPAGGLMPFAHPNHYLYANPLGYGLNGNSRLCMQYSPVQHLATPLFNPAPVPVYQPVARANCFNPDELMQTCAVQDSLTEANKERVPSVRQRPSETQATGGGGKVDNSATVQTFNTAFSLFHFGGPVALSSEDVITGDVTSKTLSDQVENNTAFNNMDNTMEEYNLFAASNGIQFSIF